MNTMDTDTVSEAAAQSLHAKTICLVFEHALAHYSRLIQEIEALQQTGASVVLLTAHEPNTGALGLETFISPLFSSLGSSTHPRRLPRILSNTVRTVIRGIWARFGTPRVSPQRLADLTVLSSSVDVFWVIDYPSLASTLSIAKQAGIPVIYEAVDLVAEYPYQGNRIRQRNVAAEKRLLRDIDGFITACDGYADYFVEVQQAQRPFVRDNMPATTRTEISPSRQPYRFLFFGSLMFDRPVIELIEGAAQSRTTPHIVFQGLNYRGQELQQAIEARGLQDFVKVVDPCPPEEILDTVSAYDISIVALYGNDENERRASTSKLFTSMAAGLAILASDLPGIARIVRQYENGLLVESMRASAWARAFDEIQGLDPRQLDTLKQQSLSGAAHHLWENQKEGFLEVFAQALQTTTQSEQAERLT